MKVKDIANLPDKKKLTLARHFEREGYNRALDEIGNIEINEASEDNVTKVISNVSEFHNHQDHAMPERYWKFIIKALHDKYIIIKRGDE